MTIKNTQPICVLGCIDTLTGHAIAGELLGWLKWYYTVFEVWHDGTQYEYPLICRGWNRTGVTWVRSPR